MPLLWKVGDVSLQVEATEPQGLGMVSTDTEIFANWDTTPEFEKAPGGVVDLLYLKAKLLTSYYVTKCAEQPDTGSLGRVVRIMSG